MRFWRIRPQQILSQLWKHSYIVKDPNIWDQKENGEKNKRK